jgi:hypothetical protein
MKIMLFRKFINFNNLLYYLFKNLINQRFITDLLSHIHNFEDSNI